MVHALTIFISAFLLFLVQLIIGKRILPWFGGAPAVWTTCMLFFQLLLLAGYAYAHFLSARFSNAAQARIHSAVLLLSVVLLSVLWWTWGAPILPGENWKPTSPEQPVWQILKLLSVSVGLPFFILSSTSPLVQRWYSFKADGERTYRLYALSNVGSMLALLSYPFLIEPWSRLSSQGNGWGIFYLVFVAGCLGCAAVLPRKEATDGKAARSEVSSKRPTLLTVLLWLLLAAMTSSMLLSVTNNLCQEVAVVPFLWVFPLALYLLTFIICFDSPRWYNRRWFVLAGVVSSIVALITAFQGVQLGVIAHIASYGLFLFLFCMLCHGELVALRPAITHLTLFYLMVALGGAIGGIFVGLIAPMIFRGYFEFHFVLMAGWGVLAIVFAKDKKSFFYTGDRLHLYLFVFVLSYLSLRMMLLLGVVRWSWLTQNVIVGSFGAAFGISLLVALLTRKTRFVHSKYWPRILIGALLFVAECFMLNRVRSGGIATQAANRNFYGVTRVETRVIYHDQKSLNITLLTHGQINHGIQFTDQTYRNRTVSYYSANSGIGKAFEMHPRRIRARQQPMNVGVLGLGVGTLAAFARKADHYRFYEINPVIVEYSQGEKPLFTYLRDCVAEVKTVLGDARLSLQNELTADGGNSFDILVMDAFSSDSVPVHLLTSEAFELYLKHLRDDDSILAINISNRFLDFRDLMFSMANRFGLKVAFVDCIGDPPDNTPSRWCLMSRGTVFDQPEFQKISSKHSSDREIVWTDDFSNLFHLLKVK